MKKTIITAMLLITLPLLIGADDSALEKERARVKALDHSIASLCGLEGVGVVIEGLPGETTQAGLTENQLKTDIELKLRLAGIKVLNQDSSFAIMTSCILMKWMLF